jgi:transglutaminase-like putative cysteine protease/predicted glutamine amidotransferase
MPNLLAMSFEGELAPSFDLRCLQPGHKLPDGWGLGYYPGGEPSAQLLREAAPPHGSIRSELVKAWQHLASSVLVIHIRTATWGHISDANTQPFSRSWGGRDWLFAHSGSLRERIIPEDSTHFTPVGSTDTELVFCDLLSRFARHGWRSIGDVDPQALWRALDSLNAHGSLTTVLTDGRDVAVYADRNDDGGLHLWHLRPPYGNLVVSDEDLEVDLTRRGIKSRKGIIVCSSPLASTTETPAEWKKLEPGHLAILRQGALRSETSASSDVGRITSLPSIHPTNLRVPSPGEVKRFDIVHTTTYGYDKPIERSTHVLRLRPADDSLQRLLAHELTVSVDGQRRDYDDVFGNRVRRMLLETTFNELTIEARSTVEVRDVDPLHVAPLRARSTIPLVWMPWQGQVLQPFLLPPELPESELHELVEYAMTFVERNGYDLLDTLLDLNSSIHREYAYVQGSTTITTTPFEVYTTRKGVCQDFTNLFICLARLLGVPARYTCGYIYTGPKNPNQIQSEASHAWAQVYLPEVGWRGFDPTNGIVTQTDHVRVAVGRNWVDAAPTAGTIYVGGGGIETLTVNVRVEPSESPDRRRRD